MNAYLQGAYCFNKRHIVIVVLQFYWDIIFIIKQVPVIQEDTRSFLTGSCNGVEIQVTIYLIVGSLIRETKYWYKYILKWSIVCILLYFPLENITLVWKCHHCQEGLQNLGVCSAPMSTDQWPGKVLCCDTGPQFLRSPLKDHANLITVYDQLGILKTYVNPNHIVIREN